MTGSNLDKMNQFYPAGKNQQLMSQTSDWNTILEKVGKSQDKAAFARLFEHFSPLLKSFLLKGGNLSAETVEDLVQETMIKVWRKSPTYSSAHASASTWIYTIARNTRVDWYRKQTRQDPRALNADDLYDTENDQSPHSTLVQFRTADHIGQHLRELPEEQAKVLTMMYFQGMSGQQVADALQLSLGTVKSRIRLALAKLRIGVAAGYRPGAAVEGD